MPKEITPEEEKSISALLAKHDASFGPSSRIPLGWAISGIIAIVAMTGYAVSYDMRNLQSIKEASMDRANMRIEMASIKADLSDVRDTRWSFAMMARYTKASNDKARENGVKIIFPEPRAIRDEVLGEYAPYHK